MASNSASVSLPGLLRISAETSNLPMSCRERRPSQVVQVGTGDLELLADHVGVRTDSLGVPARETVVHAECSDQLEQLLGGLGRRLTDPPGTGVGDDLAQLQRRADAHRDLEPGRRLVGERERQAEQHRQREQPACHPVEGDHHRRRRRPRSAASAGSPSATSKPSATAPTAVHANATDAANGTTSTNTLMARAIHGLPIHCPSPLLLTSRAPRHDRGRVPPRLHRRR